jgi:hypothetical protein
MKTKPSKEAMKSARKNGNWISRREEIDYILFGCLSKLPKEFGIDYSKALKISRILIDNGVRVVGI